MCEIFILRQIDPKADFLFGQQTGSSLKQRFSMLYTLVLILAIIWLPGSVSSYTMGGFIHILLAVAIVLILVRMIQGRKQS
jgi:tryptophan-rich sensory protein